MITVNAPHLHFSGGRQNGVGITSGLFAVQFRFKVVRIAKLVSALQGLGLDLYMDVTKGVVHTVEIHFDSLLAVVDSLIKIEPAAPGAVNLGSTDVHVTDRRYRGSPYILSEDALCRFINGGVLDGLDNFRLVQQSSRGLLVDNRFLGDVQHRGIYSAPAPTARLDEP